MSNRLEEKQNTVSENKPKETQRPQGLAVCYKAPGITSFSYLGAIKRYANTRKVGHTGTLDKFATGMLIALIGPWTKLGELFTGQDKHYEAVFHFGEERSTLDPEGDIVREAEVPSLEAIEAVLPQFFGRIMQVPPQFSAVHVGGKRAYQQAAKGEVVEIPPREIEIYAFEIVSWETPRLRVRIHCSKGTYIRSLARDLARACDSAAYVEELHRSVVGPFVLSDFTDTVGDFVFSDNPALIAKLPGVASFEVSAKDMRDLSYGQFSRYKELPSHKDYTHVILTYQGSLAAALAWSDEKRWTFRFVAAQQASS